MSDAATTARPSLHLIEMVMAAALVLWLAAAAFVVRLEYYDGLDSIVNARYFTGQIGAYTATRGPLIGLLLTPAEWVRQALALHPLEFRPHHMVMAVLHALFLYFSYTTLRGRFGRTPATLLAFVAAVPTYIVFSYLPFVSHDLFPGVVLLAMVRWTSRYLEAPTRTVWLVLAALGAAAASTKHVFGLFWFALLLAALPVCGREGRAGPYAGLIAAAAIGAAATWVLMCASLAEVFPEAPWWRRALEQVRYLSGAAHDQSRSEPWWVYARNLPAFGLTTALLVVPGLWLSLRGTPDQRLAARVWLLLIVIMHLLPLRQVRYLAFLGPLTAYVTQPVWQFLWTRKCWLACPLVILVLEFAPVHPYSRLAEASRIVSPFYRADVLGRFMHAAETAPGQLRTPVYMNTHMLSFAPDHASPLHGDIYHALFHVGYHHIYHLYGLRPGELVLIHRDEAARVIESGATGTLIHASTGILIHRTSWYNHGTDHRNELRQTIIPLPAPPAAIRVSP